MILTEKRNLKRIFLFFIYPIIYFLKIIPRKKNIWIFGNFKGFIDNPKYLYEYISNNKISNLEIYWITRDKSLYNSFTSSNKNVLYYYSLKAVWISFRAGVSFLANGYSDLNKLAAINSYIVHLWHGTPIKKIYFDAELETKFYSFGKLNKFMTFLAEESTQFLNNKIDLFLVSSEFELERMRKAFRISKDVFRITGVPRQDIIGGCENESLGIIDIFAEFNTTKGKNIVYAPTWRDRGWSSNQILHFQQKFVDFLEEENLYFFIKRHPLTTIKEIENWNIKECNRIKFIGNEMDINGIYQFVDIIITDFSSVMFDFGIFKRPILFFITDLKDYGTNRGFYDDIVDISNNKINENWEDLLYSLDNIDYSSQFINHPHFKFLVENPKNNVRKNIVRLVNEEIKNV